MFDRLQAFQQEMGHCKVPKGFQRDVELANWVRSKSHSIHARNTGPNHWFVLVGSKPTFGAFQLPQRKEKSNDC
jgi:hypothetical protein